MKGAPFQEAPVAADTTDSDALAARQRLQTVLDQLNPAGGKVDPGDGSGKGFHKWKKKKRAPAKIADITNAEDQ